MKTVSIEFGSSDLTITLPDNTDILSMPSPQPLADPAAALQHALMDSIGSPGLDALIDEKLTTTSLPNAVVVISDHTRPVPYTGEEGILWPIVEKLLAHGIQKDQITVLVAPGTHHPLTEKELRWMLDPRVFDAGVHIKSHDCRDKASLLYLNKTQRGSEVYINREYMEADIKILTGLVESHFLAGASGGRKAVCPGLIGEETTYIFHSAEMVADPQSRDLNLEGNPSHLEALEVAQKAGVDYIVNVTLDKNYKVTGVFAGDLEQAHVKAVEWIRDYVTIPLHQEYDIVATHAGFVGINHYQSVKAGLAAMPAIKEGGHLLLVAANTDTDPIGTQRYQTLLHLMKMIGPENFTKLIFADDWVFVPDQWEVQAWAKLLMQVPVEKFIYYSPYLSEAEYELIPGVDGNCFLPTEKRYMPSPDHVPIVIAEALEQLSQARQQDVHIAFLADGPYGIVTKVP